MNNPRPRAVIHGADNFPPIPALYFLGMMLETGKAEQERRQRRFHKAAGEIADMVTAHLSAHCACGEAISYDIEAWPKLRDQLAERLAQIESGELLLADVPPGPEFECPSCEQPIAEPDRCPHCEWDGALDQAIAERDARMDEAMIDAVMAQAIAEHHHPDLRRKWIQ